MGDNQKQEEREVNDTWLDTNVILCFLIRDNEPMFWAACDVFEKAEAGSLVLHIHPVIVAELVWTLDSFYGYTKEKIATTLCGFFTLEGLVLHDRDAVLSALLNYKEKNVDYIDAYLAAVAGAHGDQGVITFDKKHFPQLLKNVTVLKNK